ncbi:MAG: Gfo/Idh/MocA family oxidoreductase [Candidatus Hydrogenedentota bacterium]
MSKRWKLVGIDFDHMHMGDNLRVAFKHPDVDIVGICDESRERMGVSIENFGIADEAVFTDIQECLDKTQPDIVMLCPSTGRHAEVVEAVASSGAHIILEKPYASSLADADRIAAAMGEGQRLAINWPLAWYPPHVTAKRLIDEGRIGDVLEVHFYDGNRGPLWHVADKIEVTREDVEAGKADSWFYKKELGGGSLLDYMGYGTTLGTWYQGGRAPIEVTSMTYAPEGLEVDEHSISVARYAHGLSKFETRWGTFTDPWTHQPQPKCGFVIVGSEGTISSYDYAETIRVQSESSPEGEDLAVDTLNAPFRNAIQYMVHCIENDLAIAGPLSTEICRIGQQIVDTAFLSAQEKRTLPLVGGA